MTWKSFRAVWRQRAATLRAESIISDALAEDAADQRERVRHARLAREEGRHPSPDGTEMLRLQWAVETAESYLAVVERRLAAWRRERAFDRDVVERVLLMARIADFRELNARAWDEPVGEAAPMDSHLAVLTAYLRRHHPPSAT